MGIVLYALTSGKHPFRRESEAATMYTIASDEAVVPPSKFVPNYPASLEAVLLKALAKDKHQRFASASEFLRALDQCLPPAERANTDEDVGTFILKLFSNKREESRAALAEALALADKSRPDIRATPPPRAPRRSLAEVRASAGSLGDESKTFGILGTPPAPTRKRTLLVLALGGALLLAAAAAFALSQSTPVAADGRKPLTEGAHAGAVTSAGEPPAAEPQALPELESATEAKARVAPSASPPPVATRTPSPPKVLAPAQAPPTASAKAKPPSKWRIEPGF
jgi:serine/threonine-protein kinase